MTTDNGQNAAELSGEVAETAEIVEVSPRPDLEEANTLEAKADPSEKPRLRGFGYLYKRGNFWWIRYSVRGKDFRESSGSEQEADAMRLLKRRWKEVGRGRFIGPSEERVMVDDLLETLELDYRNNERRSLGDLKWRLRHLRAAFGGMRAIDVTGERIEQYKALRLSEKTEWGRKPVRPATVNRELAALRRAFRLAIEHARISAAPKITMLAENNARQGFLEPADFEATVNSLPGHLQDFARFAYVTGWRKGELQSLAWADVKREAKTILLRSEHSKNKEPRLLSYPPAGELDEIIERRWQARAIRNSDGTTGLAESVFHKDGKPIGDFRKAWAAACEAAKTSEILFHDLRRSAVRNLDRSGVTQAVAKRITGHRTDSVYQRYRIVSESDIRDALEKTQAAVSSRAQTRKVEPISAVKEVSR